MLVNVSYIFFLLKV